MAQEVQVYKLTELFALIPDFEGDAVLLESFITACNTAFEICTEEQQVLLTIHIKNKLKGRASQVVNSKFLDHWVAVRNVLLENFGDKRNLSSLIHDLQLLKQGKDNPKNYVLKIQSMNSKIHAAINIQPNLSNAQRQSQRELIDNMCLDQLLTGLEPRLGQIIRASNPLNILEASQRIERESQLIYLENKSVSNNFNRNFKEPRFKSNRNFQNKSPITCFNCGKQGHKSNECRLPRNVNPQSNVNTNFNHNSALSQPSTSRHNYNQRFNANHLNSQRNLREAGSQVRQNATSHKNQQRYQGNQSVNANMKTVQQKMEKLNLC